MLEDSFSHDEVCPQPYDHLYVSLRSGRSVRKEPDVDRDAETALQFDTEPAVELEDLEAVPSNDTLPEDSHQPEVHLDYARNEPDTSTDTNDLPNIDMDRPLRVTFGKELRYAPSLTELICFPPRRHTTVSSLA